MRRTLRRFLLAGAIALASATAAHAQRASDCDQAGRAAEQSYGLPPGLLLAIGTVESGRWDPRTGRVAAWPWSLDVDGQGRQFDSADAAVTATRQAQLTHPYNIDVGCFQISLRHHPDAFPSLADAFDPAANARFAAGFLAALRARLGNWQDAVAAYHSAEPGLGVPYRQRVFAAWTGEAGTAPADAPFTTILGIHIWVPVSASAAAGAIAVTPAAQRGLPRIIVPSR